MKYTAPHSNGKMVVILLDGKPYWHQEGTLLFTPYFKPLPKPLPEATDDSLADK